MILKERPKKVKLSMDLTEENYNMLLTLKEQTHLGMGYIINTILSETLKAELAARENNTESEDWR